MWILLAMMKKSRVFLFKENLKLAVPENPLVSVTLLSDSTFRTCALEESEKQSTINNAKYLIGF
jgi:hypothetical protein